MVIDHQPDQLWPGDGGVGVIHLNGHPVGQGFQVIVIVAIAAQDVLQRRRGQEEFLLQPQFLARRCGVIGVKHAAQGARQGLGFGGGGIIAPVEAGQVELGGGFGPPQPITGIS